ncbi:methyltransferase-like protein 21B [Angomonas deanei]|nr:methyltransferase-like protein 21B [Angomonas deanei]|eukprot:EPY40019.1 methyltransferase-like protein 21B [Angomonas deanei]
MSSLQLVSAIGEAIAVDERFVWMDVGPHRRVLVRSKDADKNRSAIVSEEVDSLLNSDTLAQYVWPSADYMCKWVHKNKHLFHGKTVLELGSGTGVVGFTVSQYASSVVLTDCSAVSLALLNLTKGEGAFSNCIVSHLCWGDAKGLDLVKQSASLDAFDIVIGSDVFYFNFSLHAGLKTARDALGSTGTFYCGSVARSERMEDELQEVPMKYGFGLQSFEEVDSFQLYSWVL